MVANPNAELERKGSEMMPPSVRLNLMVIRVADLEKAQQFYEGLGLQFVRHRHGNGPEHLSAELGEAVFELYPQSQQGSSTRAVRLGFSVPHLDEIVALLPSEAVHSSPQDSPWGRRAVVIDPDGHKIELVGMR